MIFIILNSLKILSIIVNYLIYHKNIIKRSYLNTTNLNTNNKKRKCNKKLSLQ